MNNMLLVISSLMLREIHTLYGGTALGYLWAVIQAGFGIVVFLGIRLVTRAQSPHGMSPLVFLACGFLIWNIFSQALGKAMASMEANRNLLTFPQIFPLDIILARTLVITATQIVCVAMILVAGTFFGYPVTVSHVGLLLLAVILAVVLGLGCGTLLSALSLYAPVLHKLVPMGLRIMFFVSGVFFSVGMFSHSVGSWLLLNPVMQLIEMTRTAMSVGYVSPYFDVRYLLFFDLAVLSTGLLLERFMRRRLLA